jgi:general stress protein 26
MEQRLREEIVHVLESHRVMTLATSRADGWPQATIVGFVSQGLVLFCFVSRLSQKFVNIKRDARVSVAIGSNFTDPSAIKGLSLGGRALEVSDPTLLERVWTMFTQRFPEYAGWGKPSGTLTVLLRIEPEVISLVDYTKGFGHSELVQLARHDLAGPPQTHNHRWL